MTRGRTQHAIREHLAKQNDCGACELAVNLNRNDLAECLTIGCMLCEIMLEIIERTLSVFIRCTDNLMLFLVIAEYQPCELQSTKIRLVAQRREILAQVIEVKAVERLFII